MKKIFLVLLMCCATVACSDGSKRAPSENKKTNVQVVPEDAYVAQSEDSSGKHLLLVMPGQRLNQTTTSVFGVEDSEVVKFNPLTLLEKRRVSLNDLQFLSTFLKSDVIFKNFVRDSSTNTLAEIVGNESVLAIGDAEGFDRDEVSRVAEALLYAFRLKVAEVVVQRLAMLNDLKSVGYDGTLFTQYLKFRAIITGFDYAGLKKLLEMDSLPLAEQQKAYTDFYKANGSSHLANGYLLMSEYFQLMNRRLLEKTNRHLVTAQGIEKLKELGRVHDLVLVGVDEYLKTKDANIKTSLAASLKRLEGSRLIVELDENLFGSLFAAEISEDGVRTGNAQLWLNAAETFLSTPSKNQFLEGMRQGRRGVVNE